LALVNQIGRMFREAKYKYILLMSPGIHTLHGQRDILDEK